jgi:hypothetical protein
MAFLEITQMIQSTQEVLKRTLKETGYVEGRNVVPDSARQEGSATTCGLINKRADLVAHVEGPDDAHPLLRQQVPHLGGR